MGLDAVELVMDVEDRFGIRIGDAEAEACRTVGELTALVKTKVAARSDLRVHLREGREELRRVLRDPVRFGAVPAMRTPLLGGLTGRERRRLWAALADAGVRLPRLRLPRPMGWVVFTAITASLVLPAVIAFALHDEAAAAWAAAAGVVLAFGIGWAVRPLASIPPEGLERLAELVRFVAAKEVALGRSLPGATRNPPTGLFPMSEAAVDEGVRRVVAESLAMTLDDVQAESRFVEDLRVG